MKRGMKKRGRKGNVRPYLLPSSFVEFRRMIYPFFCLFVFLFSSVSKTKK